MPGTNLAPIRVETIEQLDGFVMGNYQFYFGLLDYLDEEKCYIQRAVKRNLIFKKCLI